MAWNRAPTPQKSRPSQNLRMGPDLEIGSLQGIISYMKMNLGWNRAGSKSSMTHVLVRRGEDRTQSEESHVTMKEEI